MTDDLQTWLRANMALTMLCIDPVGLGGLWVKSRCGAVRDCLTSGFSALPLDLKRIHPAIADDQLFGGIDLSATLSAGRVIEAKGLMRPENALILTMAERTDQNLGARLSLGLDQQQCGCVVALDEGVDDDEHAPLALTDRLAFHVHLDGISCRLAEDVGLDENAIMHARMILPDVKTPQDFHSDLVKLAVQFGINSVRAPLFALKTARCHAAFFERTQVDEDDIEAALTLVYAPRAQILPDMDETETPADPTPDQGDNDSSDTNSDIDIPQDMLIEAIKAAIPKHMLDQFDMGAGSKATSTASGSGSAHKGNRRGRPLPARAGRLSSDARVDLLATLRTAAPWQTLRRQAAPTRPGLHIRPSDIKTKRYQQFSDRLLIFTVDASGSSAVTRLNEAKGAIELLLAQAYARRDHVALVAFRGDQAELLLQPTRSLVQTKKRLAALPGGGGTPFASGLHVAMDVARNAHKRGLTPTIVILTDGRANVALDGRHDRSAAMQDAEKLSHQIRAQKLATLVIDTAQRPQPGLKELAAVMNGTYIALPRADAHRLSATVSSALEV
ncbi:magnesium chelatase subunit D [Parasulfitobacter algicola]|uniref:Mg-protoporphyrin IX chelatase n=1 Tax=Parasulfitobacter algicola TaxID=2614809 RepID=A0ABX2IKE7_9RHOB|nr:magnesium chelatase subunit D [Sulfitobacter algicola]NSX53344.1 magnesium chelatase subunit D [Sulfitobacter algicola]